MTPPRSRVEVWLLGDSAGASRDLASLDGLRGIAVLMVFATHCWSMSKAPRYGVGETGLSLSWWLSASNTGVTLFFVLSGFLLSRRFLVAAHRHRRPPPWRKYARERVLRIVPLYWVVLAAAAVLMTPYLSAGDRIYSADGFVAMLAYIPMLSGLFPWSFGRLFVISPVWTLSIEVVFYAVVPFVARWFARGRWKVSLPLSIVISFGWLALWRSGLGTSFATEFGSIGDIGLPGRDYGRIVLGAQIPTHAFAFAAGMAIADIYVARGDRPRHDRASQIAPQLVRIGVVMTLVVLGIQGWLRSDHGLADPFRAVRDTDGAALTYYFMSSTAPVVGFSLILAGLVLGGGHHPIIGSRSLRIVGILGYGIFLWHFPIVFSQSWFTWLAEIEPAYRFPIAFSVAGVTVGVLSVITWFGVERPWIERSKRSSPSRTTVVEARVIGDPGVRDAIALPAPRRADPPSTTDIVTADVPHVAELATAGVDGGEITSGPASDRRS